jgi:hypothetical protein
LNGYFDLYCVDIFDLNNCPPYFLLILQIWVKRKVEIQVKNKSKQNKNNLICDPYLRHKIVIFNRS